MKKIAGRMMLLAVLAVSGCKGETVVKDNPETADNLAKCESNLKEKVEYINTLNERITAGRRELREIRQDRRAAIEREESKVRFAVIGWMPILVLGIGLWRAWQRRHPEEARPAAALRSGGPHVPRSRRRSPPRPRSTPCVPGSGSADLARFAGAPDTASGTAG